MTETDVAVLPHKNDDGIFMKLRFPYPRIFQCHYCSFILILEQFVPWIG